MSSFFKYCPNCASKNIVFSKEERKFNCPDCDFEYFHNIAGAVAVIIKKEGKILSVIRNVDPSKGLLDFPGGFIDPKESAEEACLREIKEEINIELDREKLSFITSFPNDYEYKTIPYKTIDLFFLYEDDKISIEGYNREELGGYVWKDIKEIKPKELAFNSGRKVIEYLIKHNK